MLPFRVHPVSFLLFPDAQEKNHRTGLRTGRDCPRGPWNPVRSPPPLCVTISHTYQTHPHLTGGETEPSAPCPTPTGLPNFQPVISAPYGLGPHGRKNRGEQTALPRAPAMEKGFLFWSDLFPLQLHRGVSRGKRNRPGYRKGAKGGNRRRYSQVQRPLNTSTGGMAGLKSFSREAFQNRRLVCY